MRSRRFKVIHRYKPSLVMQYWMHIQRKEEDSWAMQNYYKLASLKYNPIEMPAAAAAADGDDDDVRGQ